VRRWGREGAAHEARWSATRGGQRWRRRPAAWWQVPSSDVIFEIFKYFQIDLIIRWSSIAQQISNKIWISRELNKKQHSLLKLFSKFRIQFELKIREPL
jgi:hypothetical protein